MFFGEQAWIASAEDLVLLWNRITLSERQMEDAAGIFAVQRDKLDIDYLTNWAAQLEVADELSQIIRGDYEPKQT